MTIGAPALASVYALFADADEAHRIGRAMVEEGFAACVNILQPCQSIYRWDGKTETATEVPAIFKVTSDRAGALIDEITRRHSYDVPAVVAWSAEGSNPDYARWVADSLKP